ncbi:MAG: glycine zipper domain-containing protein [Prochloraceae cyanobacterium]
MGEISWIETFSGAEKRMRIIQSAVVVLTATPLVAIFGADSLLAEELFVYPANGQSAEQQKKDEFECYDWAKNQTGFDPMTRPQASTSPPVTEASEGGVLRGAARGAAVGAATGAIAGDAGKGAAIGATTGGFIGGIRNREQQRRQQAQQAEAAQQQAASYENQRNRYDRAYAVCLEGRGYTLK